MATIREMFHEIGNWHNKISTGAGVAKAIIVHDAKKKPVTKINKEIFRRLGELEKLTLGADKALHKLKDVVYHKVNPDTGKLRR